MITRLSMVIQPSLHSCPIDKTDSLFNFGYTNAVGESKRCKGSFPWSDAYIFVLSDSVAYGPFCMFCVFMRYFVCSGFK